MASVDEQGPAASAPSGGVWAIPILSLGLGLIACCLIIPAADDNRGLRVDHGRLSAQLASLVEQEQANADFLGRVHSDPEIAQRLARRQMPQPEEGVATLDDRALVRNDPDAAFANSPFALVAVEQPALPELTAGPGGRLAAWCREPRTRLGLLGGGLFLCMIGLLGGGGAARRETDSA